MELRILIKLDNAAFVEGGASEVVRILADLAERLPDPLGPTDEPIMLRDINGNTVGSVVIE